jgi:hypothetical protein
VAGVGPGETMGGMPSDAPELRRALAPSLRLRLLGTGAVAIATAVLVVVLLTWVFSLPGEILSGVVLLAGIGMLTLVGLLGPRHWVVRLDADGYRVRLLRSAQARTARWSDVLDVRAGTVDGVRCTMVRLRDGRRTTLPVDVLAGDPAELTAAITAHLDRTHGYRRLP